MPTYYGFSKANREEQPAWFHTAAAAKRFAAACGFENVSLEESENPDPADVMDTAAAPWELNPEQYPTLANSPNKPPLPPELDLPEAELKVIFDEVADEMHQAEHGVPRSRKPKEGIAAMQDRVRSLSEQRQTALNTLAEFPERDAAWHESMYRLIEDLKREQRIAEQRLAAYTDEHHTGHTRAN